MITVTYNYYDNKDLFNEVKDYWLSTGFNNLLFVDDGSQNEPLEKDDMPEGWQLYRINEDLPFAYNLARNTAMRNSPSHLNLMLDLDHVPNKKLIEDINKIKPKPGQLSFIHRIKHDGTYKLHQSQFFVYKRDFWKVGGYDESVTGYGNDFKFRQKWKKKKELNSKYKLHEIRDGASPQWLHEKRKSIRDIPNPGYTVTRIT